MIRLFGAVLDQAAHDLRYENGRGQQDRKLYEHAREWILSNDSSHPFTFSNVCEQLGYSPSAVRRSLLSEIASQPAARGEG